MPLFFRLPLLPVAQGLSVPRGWVRPACYPPYRADPGWKGCSAAGSAAWGEHPGWWWSCVVSPPLAFTPL
ncbi:hypothetical protein AtDm6_2568 [Acetobacter tropicalis]|uniref:Uncharacterized protein n=1 Tax=Acetobacter tropicalis TaxID=104102 RepID=A0A094YJ43_9PROT|nr:hypothetical protein AtDm6_2568 [Acetobacter tropicalis]